MESLEMTIMNLVVDSGSARSYAMEAIYCAKAGDFEGAEKALENCDNDLSKAHAQQTDLIQSEARGDDIPLTLFMVHAQDHLMNAAVVRDLATEMIEMYKRIQNQ